MRRKQTGRDHSSSRAVQQKRQSRNNCRGNEQHLLESYRRIVVGASPAPHAEILKAANDVLKEKGYELEIKEYVDYIQPNLALESGDLDANYFQHLPYLESFNEERGTKLVSAGKIHYEPFGIYAGKTATLDALADGAKVAVRTIQPTRQEHFFC